MNFPKNWNSSSSSAVSALIPTFLIEFIFYSFLWQSISLTCAANLALLTNRSNTHMHTYTHVHTRAHSHLFCLLISTHSPLCATLHLTCLTANAPLSRKVLISHRLLLEETLAHVAGSGWCSRGRGFLASAIYFPPPAPGNAAWLGDLCSHCACKLHAETRWSTPAFTPWGLHCCFFFFFLYPDSCVFHCATLSSYTLYHLWILEHGGLPAVFQPQNLNKKQWRGSSTGNLLCCLLSPGKWLSSPFEHSSLLALLLMWPGPLYIC